MYKHIGGLLLAAGLAMQASNAHAYAVWRGTVKVEAASPQCVPNPNDFHFFAQGEEKDIFFSPAGLDNNGPDTALNLGQVEYFIGMKVVGGSLTTGAVYQNIAVTPFGAVTQSSGQVAAAAILPAAFTKSTKVLSVYFRLKNAAGIAGCTVALRGKLLQFNVG